MWWAAEAVSGMWHFKQSLDGFTGQLVRAISLASPGPWVAGDVLAGAAAWQAETALLVISRRSLCILVWVMTGETTQAPITLGVTATARQCESLEPDGEGVGLGNRRVVGVVAGRRRGE